MTILSSNLGVQHSITAADLNLDGGNAQELITVTLDSAFKGVRVFTNTTVTAGNPATFQSPPTSFADGSGDSPMSVVAGDVNQDVGNRPDLVSLVFSAINPRIELFLGNGGSFSQSEISVPDLTGFPAGTLSNRLLALADINGDGLDDLVFVNPVVQGASFLLSQGAGQFGTQGDLSVGFAPVSLSLGDVTGDGLLDILLAGGNQIAVLPSVSGGVFGAPVNISTGVGPQTIVVGDFNADGLLDVVTADKTSNSLSILLAEP